VVDADTEEEAARIVGQIVDPVGTFYRFGLPASLLHRSRLGRNETGLFGKNPVSPEGEE
jgi:hypothetical protein